MDLRIFICNLIFSFWFLQIFLASDLSLPQSLTFKLFFLQTLWFFQFLLFFFFLFLGRGAIIGIAIFLLQLIFLLFGFLLFLVLALLSSRPWTFFLILTFSFWRPASLFHHLRPQSNWIRIIFLSCRNFVVGLSCQISGPFFPTLSESLWLQWFSFPIYLLSFLVGRFELLIQGLRFLAWNPAVGSSFFFSR